MLTLKPTKLKGEVVIPPSKSLAHRAIICAALAKGVSVISNIEYSKDIQATISCLKELGTKFEEHDDYLIIDGSTTFSIHQCEMDCFESGSTLRFMIPVSLVHQASLHYLGRGKLRQRPMQVYYDIFDKQNIDYHRDDNKNILDLVIKGKLSSGIFAIPGNVSSQFISGLMFALPLLEDNSIIHLTSPLESKSYIDLTMQTLKQYGIEIDYKNQSFYIRGKQTYHPCDYKVEGDFSQAAFFLVADALGSDITLKGLNEQTSQGDKVIIDLLCRMGASLERNKDGLKMDSTTLRAIDIDASQCPDIIPIVALACANGQGISHIYNARRLRMKECDRLKATVEVLNKCGIKAIEEDDAMTIEGAKMHGASLSSYNDHRMAMMEAIASSTVEDEIVIDNEDCVQKSYPRFWADFKMLGGRI